MRADVRHVSQTASHKWEIVEDCVYSLQLDARDGRVRPLNHYLPVGSSALRKVVLVELVKVELELAWKQGDRRSLRSYVQLYPELGTAESLPPDLVYEAFLVAARHGSVTDLEAFCADFPHQKAAILSLAHRTVNQSTAITRQGPGGTWNVGSRFGDFELLAVLGEGAFGKVFLARQVSLGRQVALKITANRGSEARTMASLEHDNIVQVFSELIVPQHDARLLCMQYVPGTTLGKIIRYLGEHPQEEESGESILAAVDQLAMFSAPFEVAALKQRQQLAQADRVEAITLLGGQLAEALSYAHERGVLHRDIKPDNVLVSHYGRPLLVDFNLSLDPHQVAGTTASMFGGSLGYMSPEHLDAFNPSHETTAEAVDARSDIFSLGVTLFELLHLRRPFPDAPPQSNPLNSLDLMAHQRRHSDIAILPPQSPETDALEATICKCLAPDPNQRFQTAAQLSEALQSVRELHSIRKSLPEPGRLLRFAARCPLGMLILAVLVPSILGSVVNISYNMLRICGDLTADQQSVFHQMLLGYNLIVYPICVALLIQRAYPIFSTSPHYDQAQRRRRIVSLPVWIVVLGALGWLPGACIFPLGIDLQAGPLETSIYGHFIIDFVLSGLIAVTYSYFGAEMILLRVLYPLQLAGQSHPISTARRELRRVPRRIQLAQVVAALIPLFAAILIVLIEPAGTSELGVFRFLVAVLIALGMLGFCFSMTAVRMLQETVRALQASHYAPVAADRRRRA